MELRAYALLALTLFVLVALFGAFALMGPMHTEMGCPFMLGQTALCASSILEHLNHWQIAFSSILAELLVLAALALAFSRVWDLHSLPERSFERIRLRRRTPERPTLMQELFSGGILHRRAP
ncbi:hypothetical protein HYW60_03990 [Candidatus Kaiserbacteria bacterium]|nr:hypothetical protein [Candidatus Kaiserbacteria bacterium]